MERNPRVSLPIGEARCIPHGPCRLQSRCARALAPIPDMGATVAEFSLGGDAGCDSCGDFLPASEYYIRRRH